MDTDLFRILLIEDDPDDARLIQWYLDAAEDVRFELSRTSCLSDGMVRLADSPFDLVLLDLGLPESAGLETFRQLHERCPSAPVVVLTGLDVDEIAVQAVKDGAEDYWSKNRLEARLLVRSIRYAIERVARRRAEEALDETIRALQREQQLLRELLDLEERERQLVAYDIHDGFAQLSTGALMNFQAFQHLQERDAPAADRLFDGGLELLRDSIAEARRLIGGLRPPLLDDEGVVAAVEYMVDELRRRGGRTIEFVHEVAFGRCASMLETTIFRIIQEAVTNACRHSGSPRVRIELRQLGDRVRIEVRDWGAGFEPGEASGPQEHFGLRGMRERTKLLGGQMCLDSAPGQGTRLAVELPLAREAQPQ